MSKTYSLLLNIKVETQKGIDKRKVRTYKFKGWKSGLCNNKAFEWSEEYSQSKPKSMQKLGKLIFEAAQDIAKNDK
jgi:hypothetical protein